MHELSSNVDYVEEMLRNQLIDAIGREVQPRDFDAFMHFYCKKLFGARYTPRPLTYAIRQRNRYPDGILSVEDIGRTMTMTSTRGGGKLGNGNNNKVEPVATRFVTCLLLLYTIPWVLPFLCPLIQRHLSNVEAIAIFMVGCNINFNRR